MKNNYELIFYQKQEIDFSKEQYETYINKKFRIKNDNKTDINNYIKYYKEFITKLKDYRNPCKYIHN